MDLGINGRAALVTGASKGIGLASAMALAREGCGVHLVSSNAEAIERAKRAVEAAFPVPLRATALDLADSRSREQLLASAGPIDILVNNAGAIPGGGLDAVDEAAWRAAWELKLFGYMDFARLALPAMMARGSGVIVNVIGAAGVAPRYDYILGSTANAALVAFTQAVGAQATTRGCAWSASIRGRAPPSGSRRSTGAVRRRHSATPRAGANCSMRCRSAGPPSPRRWPTWWRSSLPSALHT
ncbi:2,3-dihydro-2,3-dihydroxybenzoate dehydrogenase [Burkholderia glumae]|nr:2,3-dihydro-2,3-dihydroxybenzoate dehydrogenase [Burkholderia glumae]